MVNAAIGGPAGAEIIARTLLAYAYCEYCGEARLAGAAKLVDDVPPNLAAMRGLAADFHMARARLALAHGDSQTALRECDEGFRVADECGCYVIIRHLLGLVRVQALLGDGRIDEVSATLLTLQHQVRELAAQMDEPFHSMYLTSGFPAAKILQFRVLPASAYTPA